jgi:hypothetical protein
MSEALLPQPGGFEGLPLIQIDLAFEELAVPKLPESADLAAHGDATSRASPDESIQLDDAISARIQEPAVLDVEVLHHGSHALPVPHQLVKPPVGLLLDGRAELDRGVAHAQKTLRVLRVEGIHCPPHDLDVLLRHRPRSIPRRGEGAHAEPPARKTADWGTARAEEIHFG